MQAEWTKFQFYREWTQKRIAFFERQYGQSWFHGKTILEIGCGHGEIGLELATWGADITFSDGVPQFLNHIAQQNSKCRTIVHDFNQKWPFDHYDMIINFGLLYHVHNPKQLLFDCVRSCDVMVLESKVHNTPLPDPVIFEEDGVFGGAPDRMGTEFSIAFVDRTLRELGAVPTMVDPQANVAEHIVYATPNPELKLLGATRAFWIVECPK